MSQKIIAVFGATGAQGGGLVRAIAADPGSGFSARAITRNPDSDKAKALAALGVEVVAGDADKPETLAAALAGAHGAFIVTNFWEHFSVDREGEQASNMARATKAAGLRHVVWSTLEDTRVAYPPDGSRMPVLHGQYNVPHFDSKGAVDHVFTSKGAPTTFLLAAFYWDNLIYFGMGPRAGEDGNLVLAFPLGGAKLPGIAAHDIGGCALGIFKQGASTVGQRIGVCGESLTGDEMAAKLGRAIGRHVHFYDVPFDTYRGLGFPGAEDLGNMFQYQAMQGETFQAARSASVARKLFPALLDFDAWLAANAAAIPIG